MGKFYLTSLLAFGLSFGFGLTKAKAFNQSSFAMEESVEQTEITFAGNRLIVKNLEKDGVLEIYSIVGVKVFSREVKAGTNEYVLNLPKGYYIIRIGEIAKKIAIR